MVFVSVRLIFASFLSSRLFSCVNFLSIHNPNLEAHPLDDSIIIIIIIIITIISAYYGVTSVKENGPVDCGDSGVCRREYLGAQNNNLQEFVSKFGLQNIDATFHANPASRTDCVTTPLNNYNQSSAIREDDGLSKNGGVLLYPQNPQRFVDILFQCLEDPKCHFMYHHVPKTAGTFVAGSLFPIFEKGRHYRSRPWCCD
jgi:hypothetical protein